VGTSKLLEVVSCLPERLPERGAELFAVSSDAGSRALFRNVLRTVMETPTAAWLADRPV